MCSTGHLGMALRSPAIVGVNTEKTPDTEGFLDCDTEVLSYLSDAQHARQLGVVGKFFSVDIYVERLGLRLEGPQRAIIRSSQFLSLFLDAIKKGHPFSSDQLQSSLQAMVLDNSVEQESVHSKVVLTTYRGKRIATKSAGQVSYINCLKKHDVVFCTGPAGTGKSYLAVAYAVALLKAKQVTRIVLVRPAVEAGERLGFLPGDLEDKVNPYLRPLHDALYDFLGQTEVDHLSENQAIEIAPLAFMRGRTLNDACILLDEAQNTTVAQMKMFLTRLGHRGKMVVTGDTTQTDLPAGQQSGLRHAIDLLKEVEGVGVTHLGRGDVVRHSLVQKIVDAYEHGSSTGESRKDNPGA